RSRSRYHVLERLRGAREAAFGTFRFPGHGFLRFARPVHGAPPQPDEYSVLVKNFTSSRPTTYNTEITELAEFLSKGFLCVSAASVLIVVNGYRTDADGAPGPSVRAE